MKKMILLSILTFGFEHLNAQTIGQGKKGAMVDVTPTLIVSDRMDLGEMDNLKDTEFELRFTNSGQTPITVRKVSTTEFLAVKDFPKTAIQPGEIGIIRLQHRPDSGGDFLEMVVIESDAANAMAITKVFGNIALADVGKKN